MVIYGFALEPFCGFQPMFFIASRTEDDVNTRIVQDVAQPDDGMNGFILRHSPEKCLPVFWLLPNMMFAARDVRQSAVDVKNNDLVH